MNVSLCEVGPRDGLQNEATVVDPSRRAELVDRLAASGLRRIETTSFVNPDRVPAMAGAEAVVEHLERVPGVSYAGLVLNERGYTRLRQTGLDEARLAIACTESFSRRNVNASIDEAFSQSEAVVRAARADGIAVSITLSVAFGCPFEGSVDQGTVLAIAQRAQLLAPDELVLADTIGVAAPREVQRLVTAVVALGTPVGAHLHDTRSTGVANCYAALEGGAVGLDTSVGGIGGCPFAPGATGNVATEDVVYALERDGIATGVDLDRLIHTATWLEEILGHPLPGHVHRADR